MQSRLYVNGKEVQNPVLRGMATSIALAIFGLILLFLSILLFSVIGLGIAIGAGVIGISLGGMAVRRIVSGKQTNMLSDHSSFSSPDADSTKELPSADRT